MPKFLIEREMPGVGKLTSDELTTAAQTSCGTLRDLGTEIQWVQSYVTGDKCTCVYIAPSAELIREHARRAGFPVNRVEEISAIIDPTTEDGSLWKARTLAHA